MHKDDEMVWVFPRCQLQKFKELPGVAAEDEDIDHFLNDTLSSCRFMRRGDVEDSPDLQQVIPYAVVRSKDRILVYNRGAKGGEQRLADKWSIGVGGHINSGDAAGREHRLEDILLGAARREIKEEVFPEQEKLPHLVVGVVGLLQSEATAVDRVHFGVVIHAWLKTVDEVTGSDEVERHRWVTLEELGDYQLETWSEMVREMLVRDQVKK